jgi:hypothetical protein
MGILQGATPRSANSFSGFRGTTLQSSRKRKNRMPFHVFGALYKASIVTRLSNAKKISFFAPTPDSDCEPLNSMKTGYLIQDVRRIELENLTAKREGDAFITGDVANQHASPSVGDASLVIEGEEFAGNVFRCTGSQVIFASDRFEEIAEKLS